MTDKPKQRRGFAAMSLEQRTAIARKGGASVPDEKRAFSRDRALAVEAGRKGGENGHGGGSR
jgi:general stress protein YciG